MTKAKSEPRTPGRKPGSPRVPGSGRKVGTKNKVTLPVKEMILTRGRPVELLCDVSRGLRIRVGPQAGPGEPEWCYPDLPTRINAARTLLGKIVPDLRAQEITGKDGDALLPTNLAMDNRELARRVALILVMAGQDDGDEAGALAALTDGSSGGPPRHSAGGEGPVLAGPTPPPSSASASSPNRSNGAGDPRGGRKDRADDVGDPNPTQSENFSKDAKPSEPQPGQAARCAGFIIRCTEASRPGLPNQYQILDGSGQLQTMSMNAWSGALKWIRSRAGPDADMSIDIIRPAPTAEPIRPDQRQFAVGGPDIEILRG